MCVSVSLCVRGEERGSACGSGKALWLFLKVGVVEKVRKSTGEFGKALRRHLIMLFLEVRASQRLSALNVWEYEYAYANRLAVHVWTVRWT